MILKLRKRHKKKKIRLKSQLFQIPIYKNRDLNNRALLAHKNKKLSHLNNNSNNNNKNRFRNQMKRNKMINSLNLVLTLVTISNLMICLVIGEINLIKRKNKKIFVNFYLINLFKN